MVDLFVRAFLRPPVPVPRPKLLFPGAGGDTISYGPMSGAEFALIHPHLSLSRRLDRGAKPLHS